MSVSIERVQIHKIENLVEEKQQEYFIIIRS